MGSRPGVARELFPLPLAIDRDGLDVSREYVEAIKLGRADGTLSPVERAEARALGILGIPGSADENARAALEVAHAGLQSLGVVPRSAAHPQ